jgi:hypothetical protein
MNDADQSVAPSKESLTQEPNEAFVTGPDNVSNSNAEPGDPFDGLTGSFVRLTNLPTCPLDRLSRYEATLWRQACQILFTLHYLNRRRPWEKLRFR